MKRWASLILTVAMALSVLSVGVFAAAPPDPVTLDNGLELTQEASAWTVTGYTGQGGVLMIPEEYEGAKITKIGAEAFKKTNEGKKLTEVIVPCTVEEVGNSAFDGCTGLETVIFLKQRAGSATPSPAVTIAERAFADCSKLADLVLPEELTVIGSGAFAGSKALQAVAIPEKVTSIEARAFANSGLKTVFIPKSFADKQLISRDAFAGCQLDSIHSDVLPIGKVWSFFEANRPPVTEPSSFHSAVKAREMALPNCTEAGTVIGGASCEVKKEDQNDSCNLLNKFIPIPALGHNWVDDPNAQPEIEDSTCVAEGRKIIPQICTRCPEKSSRVESIPKKTEHTYNDDSQNVKRDLFTVRCDSPADKKGLTLVTKTCTVPGCGHTPSCWYCEQLEMELENANNGLASKRQELADLTAKAETAKQEDDAAQAALEAADTALKEAQKAEAKATASDAAVKVALDTLQGILADPGDMSEEDIAALKAQIEETAAKKEETEKTLLAAQRDAAQKTIDQEKAANTAGKTAQALKDAEKARDDLDDEIQKDTNITTAQNNLRDHVKGANPHHEECAKCSELIKAIRAATSEAERTKAETAYKTHQDTTKPDPEHTPATIPAGVISGEDLDIPAHDWGEPEVPAGTQRPECGSGTFITIEPTHACKICHTTLKTGEKTILDAADAHQPPANVGVKEETPATCTEDGKKVYEGYVCEICGVTVAGGEEVIPATGHHWVDRPDLDEITKKPTCEESGLKNTYQVCINENCPLKGVPQLKEKDVVIPPDPEGHAWGEFVPDAGQDTTQLEDCHEKTVTGTVKCEKCGKEEKREIVIPGKADHTWGEWTLDADGKTEHRTCKVCGKTETRPATSKPVEDPCKDGHTWGPWVPNADGKTETRTCQVCGKTETRDITTEPDVPDPDTEYTITVVQGAGGTIAVSRTTAKAGTSITVTITNVESGFELDMIRVIGDTTAEDLTGGRRSFIMPASNVKVQASFARSSSGTGWGGVPNDGSGYNRTDPTRTEPNTPVQIVPDTIPQAGSSGQLFWDVPTGHWAAGEIAWANDMGYMAGSNGMFNPNEPITMQQMWMVLARINGTYPADMTEARRWAVLHSFADGSSPTGPVTRQQLMTALYRCAYLQGAVTRSNGSLAGFADSRLVPAVARDAFVWGISNGIITGDSSNRLRPAGVVSRAEFAVFLYRFDLRV